MKHLAIPLKQHERCYEGGEIKQRNKHSGDNSHGISASPVSFFVLYDTKNEN